MVYTSLLYFHVFSLGVRIGGGLYEIPLESRIKDGLYENLAFTLELCIPLESRIGGSFLREFCVPLESCIEGGFYENLVLGGGFCQNRVSTL